MLSNCQITIKKTPPGDGPQFYTIYYHKQLELFKNQKMSSRTVYLVTGANRGIGLELVRQLSQLPNSAVVATVRDPSKATDLKALPGKNIDVVQISDEVEKDTKKVAEYVKQKYGKLDVVIANAGVFIFGSVMNAKLDDVRHHLTVNYVNVFILFQELYPLLKAAGHSKFIGMSSMAGSIAAIEGLEPFEVAAYGASKAALNFFLKRAALESKADGIIVSPIHPGMVDSGPQTHEALEASGPEVVAITPATSVKGMLEVIDGLSIADEVVLRVYDGSVIPW